MSDYQNSQTSGKELGWEDEVNEEFRELAPGEYDFRVIGFERARHPGTAKMPACNRADLVLEITEPDGYNHRVKDSLYLHDNGKFKICRFFESIGMKKKGDPLRMNWNIIGKTGRCTTVIRDGTKGGRFVNVGVYIPAEEVTGPAQGSATGQPMQNTSTTAPTPQAAPATTTWQNGTF